MVPCCASIIRTGRNGTIWTETRASSPCRARSATSPRSLSACWACSTRRGSTPNASAIASRTVPSPIPILSSASTSRAKNRASHGVMAPKPWRRSRIFACCDCGPDAPATRTRSACTSLSESASLKNADCCRRARRRSIARPASPVSFTSRTTSAFLRPATYAAASYRSIGPTPSFSGDQSGKTLPWTRRTKTGSSSRSRPGSTDATRSRISSRPASASSCSQSAANSANST